VTLIPLGLVIANKLRMDLAALVMAAALGLLQFGGVGVLGPAGSRADAVKSISGFSQPVVITLIALFIMTQALEKAGSPAGSHRRSSRLRGRMKTG